MGHRLRMMDEHYFTMDVEKHRARYLEIMDNLPTEKLKAEMIELTSFVEER